MRKTKEKKDYSVELFASKATCICSCGCNGFSCKAIPTHDYAEKQETLRANAQSEGAFTSYGYIETNL